MSGKKPRSDSKLDNLPELQFLELRDGLINRTFASYAEAISWLEAECGVSTVPSVLSRFWRNHCAPVVAERRQYAALKAEALGDAMEKDPVNWDRINVEKAKQMTFEFLDAGDVDAAMKLLNEITKVNKQDLDERKVAMMERKAKRLDEIEEKAKEISQGGGLSDETLEMLEKKLKLI
jgi:hypothetical protein